MLFELAWHRPRLASSVMDAHPLLRVPEDALAGSAPLEAVVFMLDSGACEWEAATAAVAALHFPVMEYLFFERCVPLERQVGSPLWPTPPCPCLAIKLAQFYHAHSNTAWLVYALSPALL